MAPITPLIISMGFALMVATTIAYVIDSAYKEVKLNRELEEFEEDGE